MSVLPKMKCPHRLEPHQIQGLDFIHIFPVIQVRRLTWRTPRLRLTRSRRGGTVQRDWLCVVSPPQWLVKRAIETKEEMGDYVRAYSISQFQKTHSLPEVTEPEPGPSGS